jgi:hypothetical protein
MEEFRHIIPLLIPIVAIVMGVGFGMLGLYLDYRKKTQMFEMHHKERLLAIERGIEVPPLPIEFFSGRNKTPNPVGNSLLWGLLWFLVGLAICIALLMNGDTHSAPWALWPMAIGLAQLIYYAVEVRRTKAMEESARSSTPTTSDNAM